MRLNRTAVRLLGLAVLAAGTAACRGPWDHSHAPFRAAPQTVELDYDSNINGNGGWAAFATLKGAAAAKLFADLNATPISCVHTCRRFGRVVRVHKCDGPGVSVLPHYGDSDFWQLDVVLRPCHSIGVTHNGGGCCTRVASPAVFSDLAVAFQKVTHSKGRCLQRALGTKRVGYKFKVVPGRTLRFCPGWR